MCKRYGAILLAAGLSTRFGGGDKLLHAWRGRPLLSWVVDTLGAVPLAVRVAVVGPADLTKRGFLEGAGVACVINPLPAEGMGSSIAIGTRALPEDLAGVFVVLGDMPAITRDDFGRLITAFESDPVCRVVAPTYQGERGHPVLFSATCLPALRALRGDQGARALLQATAATHLVAIEHAGVLRDFDTVEAFETH